MDSYQFINYLVGDDALVDAVVRLPQVLQGQLAVVDAVPLPRKVSTINLLRLLSFKHLIHQRTHSNTVFRATEVV